MTDPTLAVLRITTHEDMGRALQRTVRRLLKAGRRNVVLIIHHEGSICYQHIQCLAVLDRMIRRAAGKLSLVIMREDLRFVFRLLRLYEQFNVIECIEQIPHLPGHA